ncbi:Hypp5592 [Branchiostoma lanceolatum]|uniref:Hypp5592 protein n=1 Tax=Branchiostoma lanceolatum TaxID=7740 RepID=A0A8J9VIN5_BRALA|nr:Hypp5592 [Branchiostoma lanceolatum]
MSQYLGSSSVDTTTVAANLNVTILWDDGEGVSMYGPMTRLVVLVTVLSVVIIGGMLLVSFNLFLRTEPYGHRHISGHDDHNERYSAAVSHTGESLLYGRSDMMDFSELP